MNIEDEDDVVEMRNAIDNLARSREWVIGPPLLWMNPKKTMKLVSWEPSEGFLKSTQRCRRGGQKLSAEVDRKHFDEVEAAIAAMASFSGRSGHEVAFESDGVQIGWIENGVVDNSLRDGLLEEWRKTLM